jgi:hypothetical protein
MFPNIFQLADRELQPDLVHILAGNSCPDVIMNENNLYSLCSWQLHMAFVLEYCMGLSMFKSDLKKSQISVYYLLSDLEHHILAATRSNKNKAEFNQSCKKSKLEE